MTMNRRQPTESDDGSPCQNNPEQDNSVSTSPVTPTDSGNPSASSSFSSICGNVKLPSYDTAMAQSTLHENNITGYPPAQPMPRNGTELRAYMTGPVRALSAATLIELSFRMDGDQPLVKNWKFFASEVCLKNFEILKITQARTECMKAVIEWWLTRGDPTIKDFYDILVGKLEREDVWTDLKDMIERDINRSRLPVPGFRPIPERGHIFSSSLSSTSSTSTDSFSVRYEDGNASSLGTAFQAQVSNDDIKPVKADPQEKYDAFVIFDNTDKTFVKELLTRLEKEGFTICIPQRDVPGGTNEYDTNLEFMFDRSHKVVIVKSDALFASQLWKWHMNMLIGSDPIAKKRKIVPVKYKEVLSENILGHLCSCDRTAVLEDEWFWSKLFKSIKHNV